MNVLEMLSYSGPLPIEDVLWKAGDRPDEALKNIITLASRGDVEIKGMGVARLKALMASIAPDPAGGVGETLESIHQQFADSDATIELTSAGLRRARAVV